MNAVARLAQAICNRIEAVLDNASLTLADHRLINLRVVFWSVARTKSDPKPSALRCVFAPPPNPFKENTTWLLKKAATYC